MNRFFVVLFAVAFAVVVGELQEVIIDDIVDIMGKNKKGATPGLEQTPWREISISSGLLSWLEIPYHNFLSINVAMYTNFLQRCEKEPGYEDSITRNVSAMQAFVAFVVIGYTAVAMWIGPITFSCWQRRILLVTYAEAGLVQLIFLAQTFDYMTVRSAYPLTLLLTVGFFVSFNSTNALLLLEPDEPEPSPSEQDEILQSSSTRVVTSKRARCY